MKVPMKRSILLFFMTISYVMAGQPKATMLYKGENIFEKHFDDQAEVDDIMDLRKHTKGTVKNGVMVTIPPSVHVVGTPHLFTIVATDKAQGDKLGLVEVFDATEASPDDAQNRLVNLATRGFVGLGDEVLIGGFIVDGGGDSKLLIRGVGPALSLPQFGGLDSDDALSDPKITLRKTEFPPDAPPFSTFIDENDDWESAGNSEEIDEISDRVGAQLLPEGGKDTALLIDLTPGLYTFVMEGVDSDTGVGIVEVFLAD